MIMVNTRSTSMTWSQGFRAMRSRSLFWAHWLFWMRIYITTWSMQLRRIAVSPMLRHWVVRSSVSMCWRWLVIFRPSWGSWSSLRLRLMPRPMTFSSCAALSLFILNTWSLNLMYILLQSVCNLCWMLCFSFSILCLAIRSWWLVSIWAMTWNILAWRALGSRSHTRIRGIIMFVFVLVRMRLNYTSVISLSAIACIRCLWMMIHIRFLLSFSLWNAIVRHIWGLRRTTLDFVGS